MDRRQFIKNAAVMTAVGASAVTLGCKESKEAEAPSVHTKRKFKWRMVTAWPPNYPILGEGAELGAKLIEQMSEGRLTIQVFGGGELVPPMEVFDAVSRQSVEMGHSASYYWAGKAPAVQFFTSVPFGMNTQQMTAWLLAGGGLDLLGELYDQFNIVPKIAGNSGAQMGGWFRKEINSIADIQGMKMRIPGLGGRVFTKSGGASVLSPGGELYMNLERGVIDALEWAGPYHDYLMGFYKITKHYYYPSWQEPTGCLELLISKKAYEELPSDLKTIVETAFYRVNMWMLSKIDSINYLYLKKLTKDHGVILKRFPQDVLDVYKKNTKEVINEITQSDSFSKKVYASYLDFKRHIEKWTDVTEAEYFSTNHHS